MDTLLEAIDVCDVDGFCYGNYTDEEAGTGCTVILSLIHISEPTRH